MATGRIGVTPTLRTRWSKQPTAGTTSLSGLDDNSVALVYDVGYEAVYRNGALLSRGNDYTATNGTTVTLIDATLAGDIIEILANQLVPLTDAISKGQFTAKGALLSATAASTPGVLAVGANDTVLTADSTTSTGLKWATPAAGGMTSIASGSLSGTEITISSIPATYNSLQLVVRDFYTLDNASQLTFRFNGNSTSGNYTGYSFNAGNSTLQLRTSSQTFISTFLEATSDINTFIQLNMLDYTNGMNKSLNWQCSRTGTTNSGNGFGAGTFINTSAISSITIGNENAATISGGTYILYGVK